jgi:hypothetical protein
MIIGNMRIKLSSAKVMARMRYLETLPELIVTPAGDGISCATKEKEQSWE